MNILSIETSCDETALAIIEAKGYDFDLQFKVLSSALNSQINLHKEFGGVFPSLAKREHAHNLPHLLEDLFLGTLKKTTNTLPEDIKKEVFDSNVDVVHLDLVRGTKNQEYVKNSSKKF